MSKAGQAHHSIRLIHPFIKYFIMRIFSAKQGSLPTRSSRAVAEPRTSGSQAGVFPFFPRRARRQRDASLPLPRLKLPAARRVPARLLLQSPARGGAAAPGARPAPAPRRVPLGSALRAAPRWYVPPRRPPPPPRPSPPVVGAGSAAILGCSALAAAAAGRGGSPGTRPQQRGGGGGG